MKKNAWTRCVCGDIKDAHRNGPCDRGNLTSDPCGCLAFVPLGAPEGKPQDSQDPPKNP